MDLGWRRHAEAVLIWMHHELLRYLLHLLLLHLWVMHHGHKLWLKSWLLVMLLLLLLRRRRLLLLSMLGNVVDTEVLDVDGDHIVESHQIVLDDRLARRRYLS